MALCYAPGRAAKPQAPEQWEQRPHLKQLLLWPPPEPGFSGKGHFSPQQVRNNLAKDYRAEDLALWQVCLPAQQCIPACGQVEKLVPFPLLCVELNSSASGSIYGSLPSGNCILLYQQCKHLPDSSTKSPGAHTAAWTGHQAALTKGKCHLKPSEELTKCPHRSKELLE